MPSNSKPLLSFTSRDRSSSTRKQQKYSSIFDTSPPPPTLEKRSSAPTTQKRNARKYLTTTTTTTHASNVEPHHTNTLSSPPSSPLHESAHVSPILPKTQNNSHATSNSIHISSIQTTRNLHQSPHFSPSSPVPLTESGDTLKPLSVPPSDSASNSVATPSPKAQQILSDLMHQKQEVQKYLSEYENLHAGVRQQLGASVVEGEKRSTSRLAVSVRNSFTHTKHRERRKQKKQKQEERARNTSSATTKRLASDTEASQQHAKPPISHTTNTAPRHVFPPSDESSPIADVIPSYESPLATTIPPSSEILDDSTSPTSPPPNETDLHRFNIEYGTNIDSFDALWNQYKVSIIDRKMHNISKMQNALQQLNHFRKLIINASSTEHKISDIEARNEELEDMIESLNTNMRNIIFDEEEYKKKISLWKRHAAEKDRILMSTLKREENRVRQLRDTLLSRRVLEGRKWDILNLMFKLCNDYEYNREIVYRCFLCTEKLHQYYYHRIHEWKQYRYSQDDAELSQHELDMFLNHTDDVYQEERYLKKFRMQKVIDAIRREARHEMAKHLRKHFDKSSFDEYSSEIQKSSDNFSRNKRLEANAEDDEIMKRYLRVDIGVQARYRNTESEQRCKELESKLEYVTTQLERKERQLLEKEQERQDQLSRRLAENTKSIQFEWQAPHVEVGVLTEEQLKEEKPVTYDMSTMTEAEVVVKQTSAFGSQSTSISQKSLTQQKDSSTQMTTTDSSGTQIGDDSVVSDTESDATQDNSHALQTNPIADSAESPNIPPTSHQENDESFSDRIERRASWNFSTAIDEQLYNDLVQEIRRLSGKLKKYEAVNNLEKRKQLHRLQQDIIYLRKRVKEHESGKTSLRPGSSPGTLVTDMSCQTNTKDTGIQQNQVDESESHLHRYITDDASEESDALMIRVSSQLNFLQQIDQEDMERQRGEGSARKITTTSSTSPRKMTTSNVQTPASVNPHHVFTVYQNLDTLNPHIRDPGIPKGVQVADNLLESNKVEKLVQTKIKGVPESKEQKKKRNLNQALGAVGIVMIEIEHLADIFAVDDEVASRSLELYNSIVQNQLEKHEGSIVKQYHATGGYVCAFPKVVNGVMFSLSMLKKLNNTSWPSDLMFIDRCRVVKDDKQGNTLYRGFRISTSIIASSHSILGNDVSSRGEQSLTDALKQLFLLNKKARGGLIVVSNDVYSEIKLNMFLDNELYISKSLKSNLRELKSAMPIRIILPHKMKGRHEMVLKKQMKSKVSHTSKMLKKSREAGYRDREREYAEANKKKKKTIESTTEDVVGTLTRRGGQASAKATAASLPAEKDISESVKLLEKIQHEIQRASGPISSTTNSDILTECHKKLSVFLSHFGMMDMKQTSLNGCIDMHSNFNHKTPKLMSLCKKTGLSDAAQTWASGRGSRQMDASAGMQTAGHTPLLPKRRLSAKRRPTTAAVDPRHVRKLHM